MLDEPANDFHPVVLFGRVMDSVERDLYAKRRRAGVAHATIGAGIGVGAGLLVRSTTVATVLAVAGHALDRSAEKVRIALEAGDLEAARSLLPSLVGRNHPASTPSR